MFRIVGDPALQQLAQRDAADGLELRGAVERRFIEHLQQRHRRRARALQLHELRLDRQRGVVALHRDARAVDVGQRRMLFLQHQPQARFVAEGVDVAEMRDALADGEEVALPAIDVGGAVDDLAHEARRLLQHLDVLLHPPVTQLRPFVFD